MADQWLPLMPNTMVGTYCVVRPIGSGGMGAVYHVLNTTSGRSLALKTLHAAAMEEANRADNIRYLQREARATMRIEHPNVVRVESMGHLEDGRPFLIMELIRGESLSDLICGPGDPRVVVPLALQLASALIAAHDQRVVHADVSSANVHVDDEGQVRLIDFGISRLLDEDHVPFFSGVVQGTPSYVSPEQVRGLPVNEQSDQYSFGIVLYEMLMGSPPHQSPSVTEVCHQHLHNPVPPIDSPWPLPDGLEVIVQRCLAKRRDQRFPTMRDAHAALSSLCLLP